VASTWITKRENKNGTKSYIVGWRDHAGKTGKKTFRKKREADAFRDEIAHKLNRREYRPIKDVLFFDLAEKYRELKKSGFRPKTYASYEPHINRLKDYFGTFYARDIDQEMVEAFAAKLNLANNSFTIAKLQQDHPSLYEKFKKKADKALLKDIETKEEKEQDAIIRSVLGLMENLGPATRKNCLMILSSIFIKGMQWEYVDKNPVKFVARPRKPQREMEFFTSDELNKLVIEIDEWYRCLVLTVCMTGLRLSEILGLRWGDVDFNSGKLYIRKSMQQRKLYDPKTQASRRVVSVPDAVIAELKTHQAFQAVYLTENDHGLVFTNTKGRPIDGRNLTRRVIHPALKRAGLRTIERPFHALRHSYVSMLINQGEDIKFIQKQVGHTSATVTWDIYAHLYPEREREAMRRLAKNFEELTARPELKELPLEQDSTPRNES